MVPIRDRILPVPLLCGLAIVGLVIGGLLIGFEPVSGDPDCLYRPIKGELAKALARGTLPFWSDLFGLGVPLVGESHAAAFYPPNWLLYRVLTVSAAYRLAMWLHYLALVVTTFAYARTLGITEWGAGLSAVSLALCGFQMSHGCHEPFYHLLPYLPLTLLFAERFMAGGKGADLALMAVALGTQFLLGHFQIQSWTAGLVVLTALWRWRGDRRPIGRAAAVVAGVGWAGAIASVQLLLTWDLTRVARFDRPAHFMALFAFPPSHLAQPALPALFMGFQGGFRNPYWDAHLTSADEACFYVGTIPLILACCGLFARRDRSLAPWKVLAVLAVLLATLPQWWPDGFRLLLNLPVIGHFRAPGRYTLISSVALCLLAGRGFDRILESRRFWTGFLVAIVVGGSAFAWAAYWSTWPDVSRALGEGRAMRFLEAEAVVWVVSLGMVALWRLGRLPAFVLLILTGGELAYLYHEGTTPWSMPVRFPETSPVFDVLKKETGVGLVAGDLQDLPVRAGLRAAYPNLGIVAPPPNYILEQTRTISSDPKIVLRSRRFGVTHGVFEGLGSGRPCEVLYEGNDPALDAMMPSKAETRYPRHWRVERYPEVFPEVRCALTYGVVADWFKMYPALLGNDPTLALFEEADAPPPSDFPRARTAKVIRWDGVSGEFAHDGTFDLVLRRTFVPGWTVRINGGPEIPVVRAEGGLQAVRVPGRGPSTVTFGYRPVWLTRGATVSLTALSAALIVIAWPTLRRRIARKTAGTSSTGANPAVQSGRTLAAAPSDGEKR